MNVVDTDALQHFEHEEDQCDDIDLPACLMEQFGEEHGADILAFMKTRAAG